MLKLRVQIPDIGKEYDVQCNEKAYVEDVIQDILDLICRKESLQVEKEEKLAVYSVQKGSFLKKSSQIEKWYQTTYDFRYQTDEFRDQRGI